MMVYILNVEQKRANLRWLTGDEALTTQVNVIVEEPIN